MGRLLHLARAAASSPSARRRNSSPQRVRPGVLHLLTTITSPAWVRNGREDYIAGNRLGEALYSPMLTAQSGRPANKARFVSPAWVRNGREDYIAGNRLGEALYSPMLTAQSGRPANKARFVFLDPQALDFYPDWNQVATQVVRVLRGEAGRNPFDRPLTDLVGELSTRSEDFRRRWADHDVSQYCDVSATLHHPVVGTLDLGTESLELPRDPGLTLVVYTAEPHSRTAEALALLASWAATEDEANTILPVTG